MEKGIVQIYYGDGHGKSTAAIGSALHAACLGKRAIIIQFLKGKSETDMSLMTRLEPEIKCFNFSKSAERFSHLDDARKEEEKQNLRNGFNYAKKVIATGACDLLVLDEFLGLEDLQVITIEEIQSMLALRPEEMTVICTGRVLDDKFRPLADEIYNIEPEK